MAAIGKKIFFKGWAELSDNIQRRVKIQRYFGRFFSWKNLRSESALKGRNMSLAKITFYNSGDKRSYQPLVTHNKARPFFRISVLFLSTKWEELNQFKWMIQEYRHFKRCHFLIMQPGKSQGQKIYHRFGWRHFTIFTKNFTPNFFGGDENDKKWRLLILLRWCQYKGILLITKAFN